MRNIQLIAASILVLALCACSQESFVGEYNGDVKTIRVIGPEDIAFEGASTRGTEIINGSTLRFSWALGDSLGIFPDKGNQVEFPITSTEGGTSAVFDGGGWALRNKSNYAAYYPFSVWNYHRNNKKILLDYSGQIQDGNGSFTHLSTYDYLASSRVAPENGVVCFEMSRLGAILYIDIVVPEPAVVNSLVISCDEKIFTEKADLDISGEDAAVTPKKMTNTLTLEFKNTATTMANETVRGYMAVYPVDFSDKTVYATLNTDVGRFGATVQSRVVNKGKAAFLRFSDDFTPQYGEDNGHEYVEMAPGFYWATCNVGADNPWDYGDYFAWGETEPKTDYTWATYFDNMSGDGQTFSIYTKDKKTQLELDDDVASVQWGSAWRIPSDAEWIALYNNTECFDWEWDDVRNGYYVTSKVSGYEGNQIFLPVAGYRLGTNLPEPGVGGLYWSSSLWTDDSPLAYGVHFGSDYVNPIGYSRCAGFSIRPVYDPTIISDHSSPDAIDLCLPSGLKWASFNLGASAPEEFGDYYAWGETEPYYSSKDPLTWKDGKEYGYSWASYKWCMGENKTMTKYCSQSEYGYNGFMDTKSVLDLEDDAAHVCLGGTWRMPTEAEWTELIDNCTWIWTTQNGINGYQVSSSNGNSIFLPAGGERDNNDLEFTDVDGSYWSSSLDTNSPNRAWYLGYYLDYFTKSINGRYYGFSIRPVCD